MNILIAEDSPDNRFLFEAFLKNGPYVITFAENGEEAVERFSGALYDVILMDMQMPLMDGLTATRAIRALESLHGFAETPILALTGNALAQNADECYRAGCNGHLGKPFSQRKLMEALERYGHMSDETPLDDPFVIDPPEGLEAIVPTYLASRRNQVPVLFRLFDQADFTEISKIAHDLKGTGTSYGFPELTRLGEQLQLSAKQAKPVEVSNQLKQLSDYLSRVQIRGVAATLRES